MTIVPILALALILRLALSPFGSHPIDIPDWIGWSNRLTEVPFSQFYNAWSDYLPGYLYVLWVLGLLKHFLISAGLTFKEDIIYKLPAILTDIATGYLIYTIAKKYYDVKRGLIFSALYLFNPAIWYNSSLWGQVDSVTAFFSLFSLFLIFQKSTLGAAVSFVFSFLSKPVGLLIAPLIAIVLIKKSGWKEAVKFGLTSLILTVLMFLPFSNKSNFFQFTTDRLNVTFGQYPYTSIMSFNLWYLLTDFWRSDKQYFLSLTYQLWGLLIFGFFSILAMLLLIKIWSKDYKKDFEWSIICSTLVYTAGFLFLTRVHERQLHSAITFFAAVAIFRPYLLIYYLMFSVTYIANLRFAFVWISEHFRYIFNRGTLVFLTLLNLLSFSVFLGTLIPNNFIKMKSRVKNINCEK